ncbi:Putative replication protein C [Hyphomicrobiales bacterium]|jgi:replication initiation protein RepC|nr:replication initiation protein RepC [Pseudomonadota bacterium]CAH1696386.1 putative replication protein C [Hyphomicrobiales bacterium]CAH1696529.1 Putative replication protein C [Hyphomicrobiales bacterium]
MQSHIPTTPFGRRSLTLAHVASQVVAKTRPPEKAVHKWNVFRAICTAKNSLGVTERALAVLDALLTFHPETVLTGEGLVVFPSNQQLCLRAHGMPAATLRRHLAVLVDCGLIVRRDSPNGKRYARKDRAGEIELAFGFDLSPLVVRAEEFEVLAEEVLAEDRALKLVRERITICRRDIAKMIATGLEEGVPTRRGGQGPADWMEIHALYRSIVGRIPRSATRLVLEPIAEELSLLADEVLILLEDHIKSQNMSGNESHSERHIQNSNPDSLTDLEPRFPESRGAIVEIEPEPARMPERTYPLGMVLDACPDIIDYSRGGIANWRDLAAAVAVVRPMLGISPSAWFEAQSALGEIEAAIVVAAILQRGEAINSAGGYLRGLTRRAEAGEFSLGPMLMALIGSRKREKQRA